MDLGVDRQFTQRRPSVPRNPQADRPTRINSTTWNFPAPTSGQIMRIGCLMVLSRLPRLLKKPFMTIRADPELAAIFQPSQRITAPALCHNLRPDLIMDQDRHLTRIVVLRTFLYCRHRRALAVDLAHGNLGQAIPRYVVDRLHHHTVRP
jgi:hypothetical protein